MKIKLQYSKILCVATVVLLHVGSSFSFNVKRQADPTVVGNDKEVEGKVSEVWEDKVEPTDPAPTIGGLVPDVKIEPINLDDTLEDEIEDNYPAADEKKPIQPDLLLYDDSRELMRTTPHSTTTAKATHVLAQDAGGDAAAGSGSASGTRRRRGAATTIMPDFSKLCFVLLSSVLFQRYLY